MPILECKCGMTMSVSDSTNRRRCLRCGKAGLTHVWQLDRSADEHRTARVGMWAVRIPLPGREDHARVHSKAEARSHVCEGSQPTDGTPSETRAGTTKTARWAINISAVREWLDWLECRFASGDLTEEAYSREVQRAVRAVSRELGNGTQGP